MSWKVTRRIFSILEYSPEKPDIPDQGTAPSSSFVLTQKTDARTARLIKI